MNTRTLGKSGIEIGELTLGTWGLATQAYGKMEDRTLREVVEKSFDKGVRSFDLAPLWGNSEAVVGKALKKSRDEVVYITRAGARIVENDDGEEERQIGFNPEDLKADLERSLENLKTDHVDVWLLHGPEEEVFEEFDELKELVETASTGKKIRAWGVSTSDADVAKAAIKAGAEVLCLPYNLLYRDLVHDLSGDIGDADCGILARSTLSYGLLAGRWGEYRRFPDNDHRSQRWNTEALKTRVRMANRLRYLVHDDVSSMAAAALRFVMSNQLISSALIGPRTMGQADELVGALGEAPYLPEEDVALIDEKLEA